jgi:four helix bundle protein
MSGMGVKEVQELEKVPEVQERSLRAGPVKNYTDLLVYRQAHRLALQVSKFTKTLPREEQFELGRQLRRSARSVAANLVEGWTKRNSAADFKRHLRFAAGKAAECKFWTELAADEGLVTRGSSELILKEYAKLGLRFTNFGRSGGSCR